jgi:hypothetical protein
MKKTILSKLLFTLVVGLFAIGNTFGQVANPTGTHDATHSVLVGSEYQYNIVLNQTNGTDNTYTWKVLNALTFTELDVIAVEGSNVQSIAWSGAYAVNGEKVILQVEEYGDHGDGKTCSQISQIEISFTTDLPVIVFTTPGHSLCSTDGTNVIVEFNGVAPWDITIVDSELVAGKIVTGLMPTDTGVAPVDAKPGYYTYTYSIAEDVLLSPGADIVHNLTIETFVDDNVRKNAGEANGTMTGTIGITVYQLPQISTINHN